MNFIIEIKMASSSWIREPPVWYSSLAVAQYEAFESVQWRALRIIRQWYDLTSIVADIDLLETRHEQLTAHFLRKQVLDIYCLLPPKRNLEAINRLRNPSCYEFISHYGPHWQI